MAIMVIICSNLQNFYSIKSTSIISAIVHNDSDMKEADLSLLQIRIFANQLGQVESAMKRKQTKE